MNLLLADNIHFLTLKAVYKSLQLSVDVEVGVNVA